MWQSTASYLSRLVLVSSIKKISAKKELLTSILMYNSHSFGSLEIKGFSLFMDIEHNTPLVDT